MRFPIYKFLLLAFALALSGCGARSDNASVSPGGSSGGDGTVLVPVAKDRAGKIYRQAITVAATGDTQVFQVFEPTQLKAGQSYPLVLEGHGFGGSRQTAAPAGSFIKQLTDAGYYVISVDERGFGETTGTVRVMDPDYEGQDLIAVLDWAEKLEGLRRHADGNMVVGSYGGSYGGMYQFMLMGSDPKHRLHVIAPNITPHDLTYSLAQNNVIKSGWALALFAAGEGGHFITGLPSDPATTLTNELASLAAGQPTHMDPAVYETLITGGLTNAFPTAGYNFFKYHSVSYFCDGLPPGPQNFTLPGPLVTPDTFKVPPTPFPKVDALLTQGIQDTLFNFNNGYANYQCLKQLGGDVRLLSHQSGHILPVSIATASPDLATALDPFYAAINIPEFQGPGGATACGKINVQDANFAWFEEKLQGKAGAVDKVVTTGSDFCMSITDTDAIQLREIKKGGQNFTINGSTPQLNSLLGVVGSLLGGTVREQLLSVQPLFTAPAGGAVLAGIPTMSVKTSALDPSLEMTPCPTPLSIGACDPIFFLGVGYLASGSSNWKLVDAQLTPIRGFGDHKVDMNGISARLKQGDQLGLLIYAFHAQYPITWSRDIFVPAANLSGNVQLPLLAPGDIVREGV